MEYVQLIRNANFTQLWLAQILSQVAQNLLNFALMIRLFDLTHHSNVSVALLILSFGIPSIFFGAVAGIYVDHWNRKWVLVIANVLRALLVLGFLVFERDPLLVYLFSFAMSTISQFFVPAEAATIPTVVGEQRLLLANSFFVFTLYASFIVGYSAAAPVIAAYGKHAPYFLTSVMFGLAALLCYGLPTMKRKGRVSLTVAQIARTIGDQLQRNWEMIKSNHNLYFPIIQLTITQAMVGVVMAMAPALSLALLNGPLETQSNSLIIPAGVGMISGVLLIGHFGKRLHKAKIINWCLIAASVTLSALGLANHLYHWFPGNASEHTIATIVSVLIFILGALNAGISISAQTLLQENSTDETRGKIFGALNMMVNIAAVLPVLLAGYLSDAFGVAEVITGIGVALIVYAIYQFMFFSSHKLIDA